MARLAVDLGIRHPWVLAVLVCCKAPRWMLKPFITVSPAYRVKD